MKELGKYDFFNVPTKGQAMSAMEFSVGIIKWVQKNSGLKMSPVVKRFRGYPHDYNSVMQAARDYIDRLNSMNDTDASALLERGPKCQTVRVK